MTLIEKINNDLKEAMRTRDQLRLDTLRMLKSKILTVDARGNLSDADVIKLFKTYSGNLHEALEQTQSANRTEMAEKLKKEIEIVQEYLPQGLSEDETKNLVEQAIAESGAKTKKDLGLVMKSLMKLNANVDGKRAKELASERLVD